MQGLLRMQPDIAYFQKLFEPSGAFRGFELHDSFDMQTVLADDMLVKSDRFSMWHGMEVRTPFLIREWQNLL